MDMRLELSKQASFIRAHSAWFIGALAIAAVALPFFISDYWTDVCVFWGINVLLGLSLNIIVGEVGLFNMGQMAFFAIGAYTTAILSERFGINLWLLIPISGLIAAAAGYVLTGPIIHLRGDYLQMDDRASEDVAICEATTS